MTRKEFVSLAPEEYGALEFRPARDWMLIGARDGEGENLMTASWGGFGFAWGRPIALCLIRPERYTHDLVLHEGRLSLSFLPKEYREAMRICGTVSGREGNKSFRAGLHCARKEEIPYPEEADTVLLCRVLYAEGMKREGFCDASLLPHFYAEGGLHTLLLCSVEEVLVKREE
ncbi:MAG: flavin reductase [Clostridia bacterium]|nr:flavin reductase [Clostridia bacterium]MBQ5613098.1 flavin reductase [Clostridia bacterium]MBQ5893174.1 flavin reductase [Clostridia bacterium]